MTLKALPWFGGKVYKRKWLNELLGPNRRIYAEPFFGMGAVLLDRPPSPVELVSDLNGRVVNWWKILQRYPDDLAVELRAVPYSRAEYIDAVKRLDKGYPLQRAVAFTTVVFQGRLSGDGSPGHWSNNYNTRWLNLGFAAEMRALAFRVRRVQIDNQCATRLLKRLAPKADSVVYIDPPYWGEAEVAPYGANEPLDPSRLTAHLLALKGRAVISGFGEAWDHLKAHGWTRHTREFPARAGRKPMVEVAWVNGR